MYPFILTILALFASTGAIAQEILVFSDQHHPVHSIPASVQVIDLDAVLHQEDALSADLSSEQGQAVETARLRLTTQQHHQLATAYQGIVDAWALGIQKIPAVVVDRKYVVYGEPDVQKALSRIEVHRETQP